MNPQKGFGSGKTCLSLIIALVAGFPLILFCHAHRAKAQEVQAPREVARVDLTELKYKGRRVVLDGGSGLELQITNYAGGLKGPDSQKLAVLDQGRMIKVIPKKDGYWFTSLSRLESAPATYWTVKEWSGGAHCCLTMHFFSRPTPKNLVRYLGRTAYRDGEDLPFTFHIVKGKIYLEDFDTRFAYFHTAYAVSGELFVPNFYCLPPTSLQLDNTPFKERYLKEVAETEKKITEEQQNRTAGFIKESVNAQSENQETAKVPEAILHTSGFDSSIVDYLGLLLVRRTILLLYAREDRQAWESLARDVGRYYQTNRGLDTLKQTLQARLKKQPY